MSRFVYRRWPSCDSRLVLCLLTALGGGEGEEKWWDNGKSNVFLDACAAPGNKTTHLAAIVNSTSKVKSKNTVIALDRGGDRQDLQASLFLPTPCLPCTWIFSRQNPDARFSKLKAILRPLLFGIWHCKLPDRAEEDDTAEGSNPSPTFSYWRCSLHVLPSGKLHRLQHLQCRGGENEAVVNKALQGPTEPRGRRGVGAQEAAESRGVEQEGKAVEGLTEEQASCLCRWTLSCCETNGFFVGFFARSRRSEAPRARLTSDLGRSAPVYLPEGALTSTSGSSSGSAPALTSKKRRRSM